MATRKSRSKKTIHKKSNAIRPTTGIAAKATISTVDAPITAAENIPSSVSPKDIAPNMVRRKEMVERIVASSGLKPNVVKSVLDAVLMEMGNALSAGEGLNLHPLGKVTVNRHKKLEDREVLICKLRRKSKQSMDKAALNTAMGAAAE